MTGDWRRLTLAALAAVGALCIIHGQADAAAKKVPPAKGSDGETSEDGSSGAKKPARKKKQDPSEALRAIDGALKLLEAGKAEPAAQALSTVVGGGNLPPAIMAKALLYRGIAYRQQKKPAQAIADLTSALWLKGGLADSDRKDALRQRASAYQEAGLSDSGEPVAPAMPGTAHSTTRTASVTGLGDNGSSASPAAQETPATPKQSSWSISNPFASLFGGSSSSSVQPTASPPTTASIETSSRSESAPRAIASAWSSNTQVQAGAPAKTTVAQPEGKFRIQIGMVRTQAAARALAAKVKQDHAATLATREPEIDEAVVGNMGSFFRVRVGPFASAQESQAACAKLKGPGIDCLVVTQ